VENILCENNFKVLCKEILEKWRFHQRSHLEIFIGDIGNTFKDIETSLRDVEISIEI
jgi:hypothetical protein